MKLVYVCSRFYFERKMSRGRFHYVRALDRHPEVSLHWTGPGWPGWRDDQTLAENLRRLELDDADLLLGYKWQDTRDPLGCSIPRAVAYNEAWPDQPGKALAEVRDAGCGLVICHHEQDQRLFEGVRTVHIPHAADVRIFGG